MQQATARKQTEHRESGYPSADFGPPSLCLLMAEPMLGAWSAGALAAAAPWLRAVPRGETHGVIVLPGLLGTDVGTRPLRTYLRRLGYPAHGWGLGRNEGPTDAIMDGMPRLLRRVAEDTGGAVSLIGWSLGGIFARELARDDPRLVRQVITLGSPFALTDPRQTRADATFRSLSARHASGRVPDRARLVQPIPVPSTSVYSRQDGIVAWQACIEPESPTHENVAVRSGHLGMGVDPATYYLVADRLAQPAGTWTPFAPPAVLRPLYPSPR